MHPFPVRLRAITLLNLFLLLPPVHAVLPQILFQDEHSVRVRVDVSDLRVETSESAAGLRGLPVSAGATLQQEGERTWLSAPLLLAVPPGTRPTLRVLSEQRVEESWPAPPRLGADSLEFPAGGPERAGLRLLDLGWQRSQKVQRLAVDVAVYQAGWSRLQELEFELLFTPDPVEQGLLAQSRPAARRSWRESPVFERLLDTQLLNAVQARAWRVDPARLSPRGTTALSSANPALDDEWITRIMVDHDGLVKVTGQDLRQAGVDLELIDPATLSLWEGERELPLWMQDGGDGAFGTSDYFVFVGRAHRGDAFPTDFFSPENAYFLTWGHGTGRRFQEGSALPQDALPEQDSYRRVEHYERNGTWTSLKGETKTPVESDHWQWRLLQTVGDPATFLETLSLEDALGGSGSQLDHIRFAVRGESEVNTTGPDHHALVRVDGQWVGDIECSRRDENVTAWFPLAPGQLAERTQVQVELELPLDRGEDSDALYLNWIELDYLRQLTLQADGQLQIPAAQISQANLHVNGLQDDGPLILSEDGWQLRGAMPVTGEPDAVRFHPQATTGDLFIADLSTLPAPTRILRHANARLRDTDQQADMLIVAPAIFHEALQDLVDFHSQQYTVKLVDVEAIYSEFNRGLMSTQAIQDFLHWTFEEWQGPAPAYLTLAGRASRANQMKLTYTPRYRTQVPTWWVQTGTSGATASDENFTYLVGADSLWYNGVLQDVVPDTFQDLLVGRISVYTPGQLTDYLNKHKEYRERSVPGTWMETQVMAADGGNDQVFEVGNELVARSMIPTSFPVATIHVRSDSPFHGGALDFIDLFNAGCTVLNYNGHGAIGILSSSSLFRATDIRFLTNRGKYPISFAWSCLVGYYDDPDSASMAELLMRKANAGSIAFYGSSAKATINVDNPLMMNYFFNQYDSDPLTLGQIVQLTENNLLLTGNTADIIHMYNLQGDPALVPAFPRNRLLPDPVLLQLDGGVAAQFTLRTEPPGLSGTLETTFLPFAKRPSNFQGANLRRATQSFSDGQTVTVALPTINDARESRLLLALNSSQGRAVGVLPLFFNTPYAAVGGHSPERGLAGAPLQFRLESPLSVDSVWVLTNFIAPSMASMRMTALGNGVFTSQVDVLPASSSGAYMPLDEEWLQGWGVDVTSFPYFQSSGLMYRFRIYDGEPFTDVDGDGRHDVEEAYDDQNSNGQWDPPGEPFVDSDGNGLWSQSESWTDINANGMRDSGIELDGRFVSILENERISAVDTLITVTQEDAGLSARLRWTASVNQSLNQASARISRRVGEQWSTIWESRVPAYSGPQTLDAPVDLLPGPQRLRLAVGPLWQDDAQLVHVDSLVLADEFTLLTPAQGSGGALGLDANSHWSLTVPGSTLQAPVQLNPALHPLATPALREEEQGQPGLGLWLSSAAAPALRALDLAPRAADRPATDQRPAASDLSCRFAAGARFQFPDAVLGDSLPLALARWVPERGLWVVQPGTALLDVGQWTLASSLNLAGGWVLPVALRDQQGPTLGVQVAGQWFAPGDVVPSEPVFQFQLNDADGLDLGEGRSAPQLLLDGVAVPAEQLQTGNGTTGVLLQWSPGLQEAGAEHTITFKAWDALGNATEVSTPYRVATSLALDFFANHPNPFQDETVFAWQLSNVPRSLRFEIYTAAGRLIRSIPIASPRIGYDEFTWDGRDRKGREVANGVYFLRVVADGNQSIDEVYKLARLR